MILNDNPTQTLTCNFQGVRVINIQTKFRSLGEKYNALAKLAEGAIILPWEDDDVSLPHRISDSVDRLKDHDWWNPRGSWYEDQRGMHHQHSHGYLVNCSAIRRTALEQVPFDNVSGNQDKLWYIRAGMLLDRSPNVYTHPREWSYVYRWGKRNHLSGNHNTEKAYAEATKSIAGSYEIIPRMHSDYREKIRCALHSC